MSFHSLLLNLRSALAPWRSERHHGRRGSLRSLLRRSVCPTLEALEDRCTPAGTVTGSLTIAPAGGKVWTLTGDNASNNIKVASAGSSGAFTLSDAGGTTLAGVTNPTGVAVIVFDMQGGNDVVTVEVAKLRNMVFKGGDGNNTFSAQKFKLTNRLEVVNGVGSDDIGFFNFQIGGNVNIANGDGGCSIHMQTLSAASGFNNIAGNVNIVNGTGTDYTWITDTNVGGNITVNNGAGGGTNAGDFRLYNTYQTESRAVVGGSVTVTFQDGNIPSNGIWDAVVRGSVLFNNGSGAANTYFDGDGGPTNARVVIWGQLKIVGTGANLVSIGRSNNYTGLKVGQNLVIDVVNPADLTLQAFKLIVYGQTKII